MGGLKNNSFANKMIKNVCLVAETTKSVDFELYLQNFCYDFGWIVHAHFSSFF